MKRLSTLAAFALLASVAVGVSPALADHHGGGGWHGGGGHEEWHGGGWGHGWHGGEHGGWHGDWDDGWRGGDIYWGFGFGPYWGPRWNPWWSNPYAYYPFNQYYTYRAAPLPAPTLVPPRAYWYYCRPTRAYYPYVSSCPQAWQRVPARPQR